MAILANYRYEAKRGILLIVEEKLYFEDGIT